jgi:DNA-binding HxlR family transcriptional regulator
MKRTSFAGMHCSVARTLEIVGEWWTLLVLRSSFRGLRRFDEIQRDLGIARNILTDRLNTLVDEGILERRRYQERPPRDEYRLTQKGLELYPVIITLMAWGDRWAFEAGEAPPVVLTHRPCGHDVTPLLACPRCRGEIDARAMSWRESEATPAAGLIS